MRKKTKKAAKKTVKPDDEVFVGGDGGPFWSSEEEMWRSLIKIGRGLGNIDPPNESRDYNNPAYNP